MSDWSQRVVVVTGASQGLGRAIAEAWARRGAKLALVARGAEALQAVADELARAGHEALAVPTDLTRDDEVAALVETVRARWGRIDVLVNNAGRSSRGAILETSPDEFHTLLELNLLAVVRATLACAPSLLAARGHLVNIGSLAGKSAARYLGAYPASKFALSGYTQQLRLELAPQGLHVLLVAPGPIARTDSSPRYVEQAAGLPAEALRPGGGVRTKAIAPAWLAERIIVACQRREPELVVPAKARLLFAAAQLSPRLGDWLVRRMT